MSLKKLLAIMISSLFLYGCQASTPIQPGPYDDPAGDALVCKIPLDIASVEPVQWRDFEWIVLNQERIDELVEKGEPVAFFALTPDGYRAMSLNIADIRRYLRTQNEIIRQYREYYQRDDQTLTDDQE